MTGWLLAAFRALVVLVLGCAVLVVLGLVGSGPAEITLLAVGVPPELLPVGSVPLLVAGAIVAAQAAALVSATRRREWGRWALLVIAAVTTATRLSTGAATGDLLAAAAFSAVWLLLVGLLFLPSSTEWFDRQRRPR
ncbi:hypothetical protein [Agrococcus sp. ProA11]|uniref:hypothetical protein n=1 Tax=Agrococcus chionoecetis TaxID=3153752 RepID=UPI00325FE01C